MPICTSCTTPVPYLYTLYESAYNLRLEQCPKCHAFADPYVEHDPLILILDLILLKRDVFRHLIYNRGSEPRKLTDGSRDTPQRLASPIEDKVLWLRVGKLGTGLLLLDSIIRWMRLFPILDVTTKAGRHSPIRTLAHVFLYCLGETITFHIGILLAAVCLVPVAQFVTKWRHKNIQDGPQAASDFRLPQIPLALLYASLTKFFLLFLLSIWPPMQSTTLSLKAPPYLVDYPLMMYVWNMFDDLVLDREWLVRNLLGGMAAGFGLRVVLDAHPFIITSIIIAGWAFTSTYVQLVDDILSLAPAQMASWTRYSIP
ncbi:hypothetical protein M407DRAFT_178895 [Tulasnella calospora MUT 4182]|uniref:Protein ARV n=1 Tax=Tulasnella calospora MUT 4182 TaxID=1051891 RepID=A0A0C3L4G9_9AGAM|nr:hypothetical protein M407DRAFT_178895 [Tulasnella calospora MUT 4182]